MKKWLIAALILAGLTGWLLWGNTALEVNTWVIEHDKIPAAFDGFRIAQVSDLHNAGFWQDVVEELRQIQPDIIVLTGDLIDSGRTDVDAALAFAGQAAQIAPCYFVSGNHEAWSSGHWEKLREGLKQSGIVLLENERVRLELGGEHVTTLGLSDPSFGGDHARVLGELAAGEGYRILLSHRPERMKLYAEAGVDLVFSGHAHGGQFRIPFLGGVIAPDQGLFPEYDSGLYEQDGTAMLVSRGIGNSIIPLRICNRPEILVAELKVSVGISE
jgi:predicted MPP superfamily phosphohydrolase